jgi:hypothetical protein
MYNIAQSSFLCKNEKESMHDRDQINIGNIIIEQLKEKDRTISWLARQLSCDESNLRKKLKNNEIMYCDCLLQISVALKKDFFAYYSKILQEQGIW